MQFNKVGTLSNSLKPNDMVVGSWTSKDQIPQKYWDKEENPEYDPEVPDSPEFIYTNTFEAQVEKIPANGSYKFQSDGTWLDVTSDQEKYNELVAMGTEAIDEFIQQPVDDYNKANGVVFINVHNCNSYIASPEYIHYQFCKEVWDWSVLTWEEGRAIQNDIALGVIEPPTSKEEFWSMLTPYTGHGAVIPEPA